MRLRALAGLLVLLVVVSLPRPALAQWVKAFSLPQPLEGAAAAASATQTFVGGGFDSGFNVSSAVFALDVVQDETWSVVATLPRPAAGRGMLVAFRGLLFVAYGAAALGTGRDVNCSLEVWALNTTSGAWRALPNASRCRKGATALIAHDELWIVGGANNTDPVLASERFNITSWSWAPPLHNDSPSQLALAGDDDGGCDCTAAADATSIYLLGCFSCRDLGVARRAMVVVDRRTGQWRNFRASDGGNPFHRFEVLMGTAVIAQYLVTVAPAPLAQPTVVFFDMMLQQLATVSPIGAFNERSHAAVVATSNTVLVAGGRSALDGAPLPDVDILVPLPIPQFSCDHSANRTYELGQDVIVISSLSSSAAMVRLSLGTDCILEPSGEEPATGGYPIDPTTSRAVIPTQHVGQFFVCFTYGTCAAAPRKRDRHDCADGSGIEMSLLTCLSLQCCWDEALKQCFTYKAASSGDSDGSSLFWIPLTTLAISVVPRAPAPPPDTPVPPRPTDTGSPSPAPDPLTPPLAPSRFSGPVIFGIVVGGTAVVVTVFAVVMCARGRTRQMGTLSVPGKDAGIDTLNEWLQQQAVNGHGGGGTRVTMPEEQAQATTSRYRIVSRLGKGLHGTVYLAERKSDGSRVALKYIPCDTDEELHRALKEFEVIRNVQGHPNMIKLVDMFMNWSEHVEAGPRASVLRSLTRLDESAALAHDQDHAPRFVVLVMEYFPRGDLRQWIVRHAAEAPIPPRSVVSIVRQVCALLAYLHGQRPPVTHRDIKLENVLMDGDRIVVTDFGLAHVADHTHMATRAGSLYTAAPEAWKGNYTAAVDIFAVGCMLYGLCTRRVLPGNARVMFSDILDEGFADEVRDELRGYPAALAELTLQMLAYEPSARPTAEAARRRLDELYEELATDVIKS